MSEFVELFKINTNSMKNSEVFILRDKLIELSNSFTIDKVFLDNIVFDYKENFNNEYYAEGSFYTNRDQDLNKSLTTPNYFEKEFKKIHEINQNLYETPDVYLNDKIIDNVRERNIDMYNFGKRYFIEGRKKFIYFNQPLSTIGLMKVPLTSKK